MLADNVDDLELEKVFKDLSQLEDYTFLKRLSILGIKRGIKAISKLDALAHLSLWQLTALDTAWLVEMPNLEELCFHTVQFKTFNLPQPTSKLNVLNLNLCKGLPEHLDLSSLTNLESLTVEDCGQIQSFSDCTRLVELREVFVSNLRDLSSLDGIATAPNLETITIQNTPNLTVAHVAWMVDHPTLKKVYPALKAEHDAPILQEVSKVLAPRFGDVFS